MDLFTWRLWWHRVGERELRALAMEKWDPIGVSGFPEADAYPGDEYDAYLGQIVKRLRDGASIEVVGGFLTHLTGNMGLEPRRDADLAAAQAMRDWYDASTANFAEHS